MMKPYPQPDRRKTPRTGASPSPTTTPPEAGNVQLPEPDDIWREWQHERVLIAGLVGFFFGLGFLFVLTQPIWSAP